MALGLIPDDSNASDLAENALGDDKRDVRAADASALGMMGTVALIPKLKEALRDPDTGVVFASASALLSIGDPTAFQVYYSVLTGERKSGESLTESQMNMSSN